MPSWIIPRRGWRASHPLIEVPLQHPVKYVFCMATNTNPCFHDYDCHHTVKNIQQYQMFRRQLRDIRYNFLIGGNGKVYEGRGWNAEPLLPNAYDKLNPYSILIGFIGRFQDAPLSDLMERVRQDLVDYGLANKFIDTDFHPFEIFRPNTGPDRTKMAEKPEEAT